MRFYLSVVLCAVSSAALAQAFTDVAASQGVIMQNTGTPILGMGLSFYDYDKDGWDDLTFASTNDSLVIYHNEGGTGFTRSETLPFTTESKQPLWVDYDND